MIDVITSGSIIADADGRPAFGRVTIRPNVSFKYFDGVSTVQVSTNPIIVNIIDGKFNAPLQLAPNVNAQNDPETFYIVDIDANTDASRREYLEVDGTGANPIEWDSIKRLAGPNAGSTTPLDAHINASNPHKQYVKISDSVEVSTPAFDSTNRGPVVRLSGDTCVLDPDMLPASESPLDDPDGNFPPNTTVPEAIDSLYDDSQNNVVRKDVDPETVPNALELEKDLSMLNGKTIYTAGIDKVIQEYGNGYNLLSDDQGTAPTGNRLWLEAPDGGQIVEGPLDINEALDNKVIRTQRVLYYGPNGFGDPTFELKRSWTTKDAEVVRRLITFNNSLPSLGATVGSKPVFGTAIPEGLYEVHCTVLYEFNTNSNALVNHTVQTDNPAKVTISGIWDSQMGHGNLPNNSTLRLLAKPSFIMRVGPAPIVGFFYFEIVATRTDAVTNTDIRFLESETTYRRIGD
jgi:hypothetical protein